MEIYKHWCEYFDLACFIYGKVGAGYSKWITDSFEQFMDLLVTEDDVFS
jgi:hypothetical protein